MSLAKTPAILFTLWGVHVCTSPPTPMIAKQDRRTKEGPLDIEVAGFLIKASVWLHSVIELTIIGGEYCFPNSSRAEQILEFLLPGGSNGRIFLSPTTSVAALMVVVGSAIRYQCYRELGRHFTFQVTVLKDHKLVTTGPYAIVRHPAYTGLLLDIAGLVMWCLAEGSWLSERYWQWGDGYTTVFFPLAAALFVCIWVPVILLRIPTEDRILREIFGKEWEQWARSVPYRLIPRIY